MSGIGFWGPYYSRATEKKEEQVIDDMTVEVEQNSGFHLFELHAPSMGVSFFALVAALIALGFAYGCYKKFCGLNSCFGAQPNYNAVPHSIPMQSMPTNLSYYPPPLPSAPPSSEMIQPLLQMLAMQNANQRALAAPRSMSPPRMTVLKDAATDTLGATPRTSHEERIDVCL